MSLKLNKNPGCLYQLSRENSDLASLVKKSEGFSVKEQTLYVYLTPSVESSCINPLNNRRLRSILNEVEVVVFDAPVEEKSSSEFDPTEFCNILKTNMKEESLLRIDDALSERLKDNPIGKIKSDQLVCEESDKLSHLVVGKMFVMMLENCAAEMKESGSTQEDLVEERMGPKERLYKQAKLAGKTIEYIDERTFLEKNKDLLFNKGLFEGLICTLMTDSPFAKEMNALNKNDARAWNNGAKPKADVPDLEKHPVFVDFEEKFAGEMWGTAIDDSITVAEKISHYLSSNKKTLLLLQGEQDIQRIATIASCLNPNEANIKTKQLLEPTGFFWKIKKDNVTVGYLLGSIHLTPEYLLHLNSRIRKCFEKSTRLAVEIDVTRNEKPALLKQKQQKEQLCRFTAEQIEMICLNLQKLFPDDALRFDLSTEEGKVQFISFGVSALESKVYAELRLFSGIDLQLIKQAKKENKLVEDLETLEQYSQQETTQQMLSSADSMKSRFLKVLSQDISSTKGGDVIEVFNFITEQISLAMGEGLTPLFEAWSEGNLEAIHEPERSMANKMDMTQRNLNMARKKASLLHREGRTFSCVGAAHTEGEMSVQAFLKNFGFSAERVFI